MRRAPSLAAALLALVLAACRTAAPGLPAAPPAGADGPPPKIGLVLGGGGARGFAHVGAIRALEEAGVPVALVVGTSVGSLVGALYANNPSAPALERATQGLGLDDFFDFSLGAALFGKRLGLAAGERLEGFMRARVGGTRIEQLRIPYAAVATDLGTGEAVVLRAGDVARAVRASCAIPGVFEPVEQGGRLLVDGSVARTLPVRIARQLGADVVIAVDVSAIAGEPRPRSFVEVFLRAVDLAAHAEVAQSRREADVLLAPEVGAVGFLEFDRKGDAVAAGAAAARAALPRIREVVERWRATERP